ncbi:hypothetical protein LAZ67_2006378 [Cordylochernes scorpioides]|uniref:Prostaglandin-endoperoxide synthase n=1 Tax=Cordylochernes scorpioides TaxID=51811 RepID=A0ABY6K5B0_9ARAC|nr:hypothetical protein LAZ67_2006378 [Cordylochernes scorpioides]
MGVCRLKLSRQQVSYELPQLELDSMEASAAVAECHGYYGAQCDPHAKYRTLDGSCNNVHQPAWGRAASCMKRLLPPKYADAVSAPRTGHKGHPLPDPRTVSLTVHRHVHRPARDFTHMLMVWGQFLDHDIALTPVTRMENNAAIQCCPPTDSGHYQCLPIQISEEDPFYSKFGTKCINFVRSALCPTCALVFHRDCRVQAPDSRWTKSPPSSTLPSSTATRPTSPKTSDFSTTKRIYCIEESPYITVRAGRLEVTETWHVGDLLPQSSNPHNDECSIPDEHLTCFKAGDTRVNQHPALTSLHTVWMRQHNRLAHGLKRVNPHWDDEKLFQETRRIIGAQMQMVTYAEFLPVVLGHAYMDFFDLWVLREGYTKYDHKTDPTLINDFATAAYRFGHSLVNGFFKEIQHSGTTTGFKLRNYFFFPFELYTGQLEPVMAGVSRQPAQEFDPYMVHDVTNYLYRRRGNATGLDLAAINVQRGRDHGLPGYSAYVKYCLGDKVSSFDDLVDLMPEHARKNFEMLYHSVHDIDFFSGGTSEFPLADGVIGPTFACIVGIQFYHLKFGDRFYFEHYGESGSFSPEQLEEIRKTTLGGVVCHNSDVSELPRNVFVLPNHHTLEPLGGSLYIAERLKHPVAWFD